MDKIDEALEPYFGYDTELPDFFQVKIHLQSDFRDKVKVTINSTLPQLVCNSTDDKPGYCHYEKGTFPYPR